MAGTLHPSSVGGSRAGKTRCRAGQERPYGPLLRLPESSRPGQSRRPRFGGPVLSPVLAKPRSARGHGAPRIGGGGGMSASQSRFVAIWASHEARARLWFRLFLLTAA